MANKTAQAGDRYRALQHQLCRWWPFPWRIHRSQPREKQRIQGGVSWSQQRMELLFLHGFQDFETRHLQTYRSRQEMVWRKEGCACTPGIATLYFSLSLLSRWAMRKDSHRLRQQGGIRTVSQGLLRREPRFEEDSLCQHWLFLETSSPNQRYFQML